MEFIDARPAYEWLGMDDTAPYDLSVSLIFVLGNGSEGPVRHAASIVKRFALPLPNIGFTSLGGNFGGNLLWGCTEMRHYRAILEEEGVPPHTILHPQEKYGTTNTLVEARQAIPWITARLNMNKLRVVLCSRPVHQRRAWLTFLKQHTNIQFHNSPCEETLTVELLPRILGEIKRIREYGAKGDLEQCAIPDEVLFVEKELLRVGVKAL